MDAPLLWHIPLSHYSEKVRWALDYKGIAHRRRVLVEGESRESCTYRGIVTTATWSLGNVSPSMAARRLLVAGVNSEGLIITRFPAAIAVARGIRARETG
jgi:hypothetical protein